MLLRGRQARCRRPTHSGSRAAPRGRTRPCLAARTRGRPPSAPRARGRPTGAMGVPLGGLRLMGGGHAHCCHLNPNKKHVKPDSNCVVNGVEKGTRNDSKRGVPWGRPSRGTDGGTGGGRGGPTARAARRTTGTPPPAAPWGRRDRRRVGGPAGCHANHR